MNYNGVGLMITDRCNASCAFCGLRCSPEGRRVMPQKLAEQVIDEACAMGFKQLAVTGGEPFLYPELMFEVLEYAAKAGIEKRNVVTNGFWGAWEDAKLEETVKRLKHCADHVSVSFDSFHAEYVPEASVRKAADAMKGQGVRYSIHVADVYGERGAGPFLASLGEKGMYRGYNIYPIGPYGNAADLPSDLFIRFCTWNETICNVNETLAVDPDGEVFPCCHPAIMDTCLSLGNVRMTPLAGLLSGGGRIRRVKAMHSPAVFRELMAYVKEELGKDFPETVIEGCELCHLVFKNPETAQRALEYLDSRAFRQFMDQILSGEKERLQ